MECNRLQAVSMVIPALALSFVTVHAAPASGTVHPRAGGDPAGLSVLSGITLENERPDDGSYSRSLFKHWVDADGDSCDTREEVLIAESTSKPQVDAYGCKVVEGDWWSAYDGVTTTAPSTFDIDHVVALKEAWDSGAWSWTSAQRESFANDLTDPRALIAVSASSNRSKADRDPSQWMPTRTAYTCEYLANWVAVKSHWKLSMDSSEHGFIRKRFEGECSAVTIHAWGQSPSVPTTSPAVTTSVPRASTSVPPKTGTTEPRGQGSSGATTSTAPRVPSVRVVPGGVCATAGATATLKGRRYVCSIKDSRGRRHADGKRRWRRA
ncbi:MAG: DUF1524 domain-containing protein [Acidimicrobiales bacterium]